jgi:hypothetical protein
MTLEAAIFRQGFILEGSEKALGHGVVVTVSFGAHALKQICISQAISKLTRGVLAAPIGMEELPERLTWWPALCPKRR